MIYNKLGYGNYQIYGIMRLIKMKIHSVSTENTMEIGKKFASFLKPSDIVLLDGDLGAGKTHFVKGIAKGLGIDDNVTSPTFTIENVYDTGNLKFHHFDVYRVNDEEELLDIGFEEAIYSDDISVIEWASLIPGILPDSFIRVYIERTDESDNDRIISIELSDDRKNEEERLYDCFRD